MDGHDPDALRTTLKAVPIHTEKPTTVICHTIKGKGIGFVENNMQWHHKSRVTDQEIQSLLGGLGDD